MTQEFYKYYGNDGIGNVGNDTTIASADIDGVMMIAIKALAEENDALKKQNEAMQAQLSELTEQNYTNQKQYAELKHLIHNLMVRDENERTDRKSTRLNSSHVAISYAVFCLKKKKIKMTHQQLR